MLDPQKLQVLWDVLSRAPATRAELLVIQQVADQLAALSTPTRTAPLSSPAENGVALETAARRAEGLPRRQVAVE